MLHVRIESNLLGGKKNYNIINFRLIELGADANHIDTLSG